MDFDIIITFLLKLFRYFKRKENNSEIRIDKKFIQNGSSSTLKIILPPWRDGESIVTKILIRRLCKKGHSCLVYFFPRQILSTDVYKTVKIFNFIKDQIRADIIKLKAEHLFKKIDIIAPSIGVVSACLVANNNSDISNLFFVVPGSCLASSLWDGIRTKKLKDNYKRQGISREKLKNIWKDIAPKNNVNALNNKSIFITISKSDKVIPYNYGKEFAKLLEELYPDNLVEENFYLGHYLTVLRYYLFNDEILK